MFVIVFTLVGWLSSAIMECYFINVLVKGLMSPPFQGLEKAINGAGMRGGA